MIEHLMRFLNVKRHPLSLLLFIVTWILALGCIIAYAGLVPLSNWYGDEYIIFGVYQRQGITDLISRIISWSPRPFSEIVLYLYSKVIIWAKAPLVTPFMTVIWGCYFLLPLWVIWIYRKRYHFGRMSIMCLSVMALSLMMDHISQVFYWPVGSAAYLLTLSGIFLTLLLIPQAERGNKGWLALILCLTAGASEMGAAFVLCFSSFYGLWRFYIKKPYWSLAFPWLAAFGVFFITFLERLQKSEEIGASDSLIQNHLPASLLSGLKEIAELFYLPIMNFSFGWAFLLLFCVGIYFLCPFGFLKTRQKQVFLIVSASLLFAAFFSSFAAFYHFGQSCCERHDTTRHILLLFALISLIFALPQPITLRMIPLGLCCIIGVLSSVILLRYDDIRQEYQAYDMVIEARHQSWASAKQNSREMVLYQGPNIPITTGFSRFIPQKVQRTSHNELWQKGLLDFFDKDVIWVKNIASD